MPNNEFKCSLCLNTYEKAWSDEECKEEMKQIWGEIPEDEQVVICDDCFNQKSNGEIKELGKEYQNK